MIKTSWWLVILAFLVVGTSTSYAHGISEADKQAMLDGGYLNYLQLGATHMVTGYDHLLFSRSDAPRRDHDVGKSATISPSRFHFIALAPAASKTCPRCSANDLPTEDLDDSSKVVAGVAETQRNLLGGNISSKLGPVTPFHWLSLITNTSDWPWCVRSWFTSCSNADTSAANRWSGSPRRATRGSSRSKPHLKSQATGVRRPFLSGRMRMGFMSSTGIQRST